MGLMPHIFTSTLRQLQEKRCLTDCQVVGLTSKGLHQRWYIKKTEPFTVCELNQFVLTAHPHITEFLCTAKVTEIQKAEGWCYIGCSNCSKKLNREETSFTCASCNETNDVAELRCWAIFYVSDITGTSSFLGFDAEVAKLTLIQASEGIGVNAEVDTELP